MFCHWCQLSKYAYYWYEHLDQQRSPVGPASIRRQVGKLFSHELWELMGNLIPFNRLSKVKTVNCCCFDFFLVLGNIN